MNPESADLVSCETLKVYEKLLRKWNRKTFLVQQDTISEFQYRHFEDSLQLVKYIKKGSRVLDIGSGAGFPGMVLALTHLYKVSLCESNKKKCVFLSEVSRETEAAVEIINKRVEELDEERYDVVAARGLASLDRLIAYMVELKVAKGVFLKGERVDEEIHQALKTHRFDYTIEDSATSENGKIVVVEIRDIK